MNQFDKMHRDWDRTARIDEDERKWEHAITNHLMNKLGLNKRLKSLRKLNEELGHEHLLTQEAFRAMFPTFPIRFETSRLRGIEIPDVDSRTQVDYRVERCGRFWEPNRFKSFNRVPVVGLYNLLLSELPEDIVSCLPVGLVFPRKGFTHGMVIHNDDSEKFWTHGSAWVFKGTKAHPKKQYMQPFIDVVKAIKEEAGWQP